MKILFLAPRLPLPADTGGKIRTFNLLKQIAQNNEVDLLCFSFEEGDQFFKQKFTSLGIHLHLVPVREMSMRQKIWIVWTHRLPFTAAKYDSPMMSRAVKDLINKKTFDVVHVDHIHMAHYIRQFPNIPCILDEHNVEFKILERCSSVEKSSLKKMLLRAQTRKMKSFEAKMVPRFSACCAVSPDDATCLSRLIDEKKAIDVLPNGVDTSYFKPQSVVGQTSIEEDSLVFTGSMDWLPNDDAALYFCKEILPLIWSVNPAVLFYVVGKSPSSSLKDIARKEKRIVLTGRVDDVRIFVERSKVFVVPLRIGGGTRLKILEALSMEKAVVSTTIGAEGIAYTEDRNIVLADAPEIFAEKVLYLLKDDPWRRSLGVEGRKRVLEKYDWNIMGKKLHAIYERVKGKRKAS